jgi:nitrite reductase (NAD(P)H)
MLYIRTADRLVRTAPWVESFEGGIEVSKECREERASLTGQKLKAIILRDELGICADLDAEMDALIGTYEDEWKKAVQDPDLRKQFRQFVNTVGHAVG